MPTPQRLSNGSITPRANPVSTFLQYNSDSAPAVPVEPSKLPQVSRITSFQRGGRPNVQGVNPIQELTDALKPLSGLFNAGAEMYATSEYKKGQNEILKAASNINRDTIQKSYLYAEQNRAVDAQNPIAGVLMDEANPFREAGRRNQASQFVAKEAAGQFRAEWASRGHNLAKEDPSSVNVQLAQASVTNRLVNAFGLDEFSPGFQQYVVPQINKGWEWFQSQQFSAHVKHRKAVDTAQTSQVLMSDAMDTGLDWDTFSGRILRVLDEQSARVGITGEVEAIRLSTLKKTVEGLLVMRDDPETRQTAQRALELLQSAPSGVKDINGNEMSIGQLMGTDIIEAEANVLKDIKTIRDIERENSIEAMQLQIEEIPGSQYIPPRSPQWGKIERHLLDNNPNASQEDVREAIGNATGYYSNSQEYSFDQDSVDEFIQGVESSFGSDYSEAEARKEWTRLTKLAPQGLKPELNQQFNALIKRKREDREYGIDSSTRKSAVQSAAEVVVLRQWPKEGLQMIKRAKEAGMPLINYIQDQESGSAEGVKRTANYLANAGVQEIKRQAAERKEPLKAQAKMDSLTGMESTPEKTKEPEITPQNYYSPGQSVPEEMLESGAPVYNRTDIISLLETLQTGDKVPSAVKRAARASGLTPGQFVLKQADFYKEEIPISEGTRNRILRLDNQSMGLSLIRPSPGTGPVSAATSPTMSIFLGVVPTVNSVA